MAQPHIQELAGALRTAIQQEVENITLGGMEAINARLDRLFQQHHQMQETINLDRQETYRRFDLLPMRIYNRSRGDDDILDGRDGRIPDEYPNTLNLLRAANRNQCNALAHHLDIPFPHRDMTVNEWRQEIANFLGIHL